MLFLPSIVITLAGLAYPIYCSSKAIRDEDVAAAGPQWLAYWIIYSVFMALDGILSFVLCYIPLYAELKLCFLLWLQLPHFNGATWVYKTYLENLQETLEGSKLMDELSKALAHMKTNGVSAEQMREMTQWVKDKVASLQKVPPAEKVVEEKKADDKESDKDK